MRVRKVLVLIDSLELQSILPLILTDLLPHSITHGMFNSFDHIAVVRGSIWTFLTVYHLKLDEETFAVTSHVF